MSMFSRLRVLHQNPSSFFVIFLISILIFLLLSTRSSVDVHCSLDQSSGWQSFRFISNNYSNSAEDGETSLDDTSIWCLELASRLDHEPFLPISPILRAPTINSQQLHRLPYRYSEWKSSSLLPRSLTPCEHSLAMRLLMIVERICRKNKISFMMIDGTLLGSLRHHDMIPWDTDLDILIPEEDKTRFKTALKEMNMTLVQFRVLNEGHIREYYKIYLRNTPSAGDSSWNFPFMDISPYIKNSTHVWQTYDPYTTYKVEDIFPLVMKPLGGLWLPSPRNPRVVFDFDPFIECNGHIRNHRKEIRISPIMVNCSALHDIYPFVQQNSNRSNSIEILRANQSIIHTIIY